MKLTGIPAIEFWHLKNSFKIFFCFFKGLKLLHNLSTSIQTSNFEELTIGYARWKVVFLLFHCTIQCACSSRDSSSCSAVVIDQLIMNACKIYCLPPQRIKCNAIELKRVNYSTVWGEKWDEAMVCVCVCEEHELHHAMKNDNFNPWLLDWMLREP